MAVRQGGQALSTSLIAHFLESFAFNARLNLHARVFYGRDDHHKATLVPSRKLLNLN